MATLTPTLTLVSTDATTDSLSLSLTDTLTVNQKIIGPSKIKLSTADLTLFAAADYGISYVYLKNLDSSIAMDVTFNDKVSIYVQPGEFAFFPWRVSEDIKIKSESGTPYVEYGIWEA